MAQNNIIIFEPGRSSLAETVHGIQSLKSGSIERHDSKLMLGRNTITVDCGN